MPNRKAGNVRHGVDGSGLRGAVVHLVCTDIRHPMGTVVDGHRFRGKPAVALDKSYTVGCSTAQPAGADEALMITNAIWVL